MKWTCHFKRWQYFFAKDKFQAKIWILENSYLPTRPNTWDMSEETGGDVSGSDFFDLG